MPKPPLTARELLNAAMTEDELQSALIEHAQLHGWMTYHTHDSRHSAAGFPDLVLIRPPDLILWELKDAKRRVTPEQQHWLDQLVSVSNVEAAVIRPADYDRALARLARRPSRR